MENDTSGYWTITNKALFSLVNDKRRLRKKPPIDFGVMTTRLVLRGNVVCPGLFDFRGEQLRLDHANAPILEELLNEQFDLYLQNELTRHCQFHSATVQKVASKARGRQEKETATISDEDLGKDGIGARMMRLFGMGKAATHSH